jgi:hypothetical protein
MMCTSKLVESHTSADAVYVLALRLKLSLRILENIFIKAPHIHNILQEECNIMFAVIRNIYIL